MKKASWKDNIVGTKWKKKKIKNGDQKNICWELYIIYDDGNEEYWDDFFVRSNGTLTWFDKEWKSVDALKREFERILNAYLENNK